MRFCPFATIAEAANATEVVVEAEVYSCYFWYLPYRVLREGDTGEVLVEVSVVSCVRGVCQVGLDVFVCNSCWWGAVSLCGILALSLPVLQWGSRLEERFALLVVLSWVSLVVPGQCILCMEVKLYIPKGFLSDNLVSQGSDVDEWWSGQCICGGPLEKNTRTGCGSFVGIWV